MDYWASGLSLTFELLTSGCYYHAGKLVGRMVAALPESTQRDFMEEGESIDADTIGLFLPI